MLEWTFAYLHLAGDLLLVLFTSFLWGLRPRAATPPNTETLLRILILACAQIVVIATILGYLRIWSIPNQSLVLLLLAGFTWYYHRAAFRSGPQLIQSRLKQVISRYGKALSQTGWTDRILLSGLVLTLLGYLGFALFSEPLVFDVKNYRLPPASRLPGPTRRPAHLCIFSALRDSYAGKQAGIRQLCSRSHSHAGPSSRGDPARPVARQGLARFYQLLVHFNFPHRQSRVA